jgi:RimJ/RimL family protein N-acetyltransferase
MLSNIELLVRQAPTDPYGFSIFVSETSHAIRTGVDFPAHLVPTIRATFLASPRLAPSARPHILDRFAPLLDLEYFAGPVYLIPPDLALDSTHIEPDLARLADANPGNWHPIEWRELLDGTLGPVAIAVVDDRVASICHTPGPLTYFTAEAGVWTHADFRGRGLACATVAAWSRLVPATGRHVFYSTDRDNVSSQRVAARLGLPLLGWTHRLARPKPAGALHPLCSVAS